MNRKTGTYQLLGSTNHFTPDHLPPKNPDLQLNPETIELYGKTEKAIAQLNEISANLPHIGQFIKAYSIKEALLSSAIENINTTILEVFTQTLEHKKANKETQLVINYCSALQVSLEMIQKQNLPLISKVLLAAHKTLMQTGDGDQANPGEYRKQSVRVGNFVPPTAPHIPDLISNLERFINEPSNIPAIIKAGIAHVQFEMIHPFLDGNGRIGRLLIVLILMHDHVLQSPILYPSYYFKKHHYQYYQMLDRVRTHGDFEGWIHFYLQAIYSSASDAYLKVKQIQNLYEKLQNTVATKSLFTKNMDTFQKSITYLFSNPVTNISYFAQHLEISYNTAQKIINELVGANIIEEMTQQKRNKLYKFQPYLEILEQE